MLCGHFLTIIASAALTSASIYNNQAYDSPSTGVRSLSTSRELVEARHRLEKKWAYYDGQVTFPYGVASGDPCECRRWTSA